MDKPQSLLVSESRRWRTPDDARQMAELSPLPALPEGADADLTLGHLDTLKLLVRGADETLSPHEEKN